MKVSSQNRKNLKRNSEFQKTNRIRLDLFSFAKNEINEKKEKERNTGFSFSNKIFHEKNEESEKDLKKDKTKSIIKAISLNSQKTSNDSFSEMSEEDSSEISCDEDEL